MQAPQVFFALCCVAIGMFPALAFRFLEGALGSSRQGYGTLLADAVPASGGPLAGMRALDSCARFAPLAFAAVLGAAFAAAWAVARMGAAPRRADRPWLCGYALEAECHRYGAHQFYGEIKRYFGWLGGKPHPPSQPSVSKEP
jgi:hypothetical protein